MEPRVLNGSYENVSMLLEMRSKDTHQFQRLALGVEQLLNVSARRTTAAHCRHLLPHHLRVVDRVFPARHIRCIQSALRATSAAFAAVICDPASAELASSRTKVYVLLQRTGSAPEDDAEDALQAE